MESRVISGACRKILRDDSGVSALEFALILPVMIIMFQGTVEFSDALTVDRRVTSVASVTADLVAQSEEVSSDALEKIFMSSETIMLPYSDSTISIVVSSVVANEKNETKVAWSCVHNGPERSEQARSKDETISLPEGMTQPFSSVIMAEVTYVYTPLIGEYITGDFTMSETFYLRPRRSLTVEKTDSGC